MRVEVARVIGDVEGRSCLIVDDMITTGGTVVEATRALLAAGARPELRVAASHGILLRGALEALARAGVRELAVTDSVTIAGTGPLPITTVSVAPLLASEIRRLVSGGSERNGLPRPSATRR